MAFFAVITPKWCSSKHVKDKQHVILSLGPPDTHQGPQKEHLALPALLPTGRPEKGPERPRPRPPT